MRQVLVAFLFRYSQFREGRESQRLRTIQNLGPKVHEAKNDKLVVGRV